jgi:periplasmic divalent cation tolerance protein
MSHGAQASSAVVIVLTTVGSETDAGALARVLVDERLAACVNLLPEMRSVYRWQGNVCDDAERQLVIKTTESRLPALELRLAAIHPYELSEFVVLRGEASAAYAAWTADATRETDALRAPARLEPGVRGRQE